MHQVLGLAIGGLMIMLCAFPISFRFPAHQAAILATVSCLFDASSLMFALFNWMRKYVDGTTHLAHTVSCASVTLSVSNHSHSHFRRRLQREDHYCARQQRMMRVLALILIDSH